jgi:hypothetical protein
MQSSVNYNYVGSRSRNNILIWLLFFLITNTSFLV